MSDQWYIDYDAFENDGQWDQEYQGYMLNTELKELIQKRFPSFYDSDARVSRDSSAMLENELFYIGLADNEWSVAVFLQSKDDGEYSDGIVSRHFLEYTDGIKTILLDMFGTIYIRASAWTSGKITKKEAC
ncbi:MAG: hypothetical protein RSC06_14750 [Clostridia bacterium]